MAPCTHPGMKAFFPIGKKRPQSLRSLGLASCTSLLVPGCVQGAIIQLVCLSVCLCVCVCETFIVFTDCESCTRPISTNQGSMEAGEYGPTRGTCFVARRLERVAVAGLLWISWCVSGAAGFRVFSPVFFLRTHTACCNYEASLPHIPLY